MIRDDEDDGDGAKSGGLPGSQRGERQGWPRRGERKGESNQGERRVEHIMHFCARYMRNSKVDSPLLLLLLLLLPPPLLLLLLFIYESGKGYFGYFFLSNFVFGLFFQEKKEKGHHDNPCITYLLT